MVIKSLEILFENGYITKKEYETILKRIQSKEEKTVNKTWEQMLDDYYHWCVTKYTLVLFARYILLHHFHLK